MNLKKWLINLVKISIAVVGLWWVLSHTPWNDLATIKKGAVLRELTVQEDVNVSIAPEATSPPPLPKALWVMPGNVQVSVAAAGEKVHAMALADLFATDGAPPKVVAIPKEDLVAVGGSSEVKVQVGLKNLIKHANLPLLAASWLVLVITFFITAWRWKKLMEPQRLIVPYYRCLALTFVGQFYSTFLPGTTSGDLVKIIYASKMTGSKSKSTVTVLLDRVIGLVALVVIAFLAALAQASSNATMLRVALLMGAGLAGLAVGSWLYFSDFARRALGIERLLSQIEHVDDDPTDPQHHKHPMLRRLRKLPAQLKVLDETLRVYRGHMGLVLATFLVSVASQLAMPISAWLAGQAFGITSAHLGHYLAYTPIAILAAALPISFLGLGVMDGVLLNFFYFKGLATASQTFALAQTIRFFPVLWNLVGSYWVVRGDYSRQEQAATDTAEVAESPAA